MDRLIVAAHGDLAAALVASAEMIAGPPSCAVRTLALEPDDNLAGLRQRLLDEVPVNSAALVLTDIAGGTPSNAALWTSAERDLQVVAGVNLGMLLELWLADDALPLSELAELAERSGRAAVQRLDERM